jgi:SAM-dependent methyltransferase
VRRRILPAMSDYDAVAFDAFEQAGWGTKEAAGYDALAGRVTSRLADPLLDAVGAGPGKRVLDIATGPGYVAARAAERGADPVGLDFSETMLAYARSRSPSVEFVRGNATELPFPEGSFDAAIVAFLLLHVGRPEEVVAEAARVVAPGGRAAFSVWDEPSRGRWLGVVFDAFTAAGAQPPADVPPGPPIFRFADENEFTRLLTGAGLVDVAVETVEFPLWLASGNELWTGLVDGTVRVRPMIVGQSAEMQRAIRTHFDELLEDYRTDNGFDVPVSVKLASGRKP